MYIYKVRMSEGQEVSGKEENSSVVGKR